MEPYQSDRDSEHRNDPFTAALFRFAFFFGLALAGAMLVPPVLFPATLSGLLLLGSAICTLAAALAVEPVTNERLTRWDVSAGLLACSLFARCFVDFEMLRYAAAYGTTQFG
ncbi:MAG: hypothetical protein ACFB6S_18205 [Geminicoccaceae bacterium]